SNHELSDQDDSNQELSEQEDSEQAPSEQDTSDQAPSDQDTSDEEASTGETLDAETLDAKFFEEDPDALLELQNDSAQSLTEEKIELRPLEVSVEISGNGELDYRTYMDQAVSFHIRVKNSEAKQGIGEEAAYQLTIDNTGIVDFGNVSGTVSYDGAMGTLNTQKSSAALKVKGVGETGYTVTVSGMAGYEEASYSGSIQVKNSALRDSDFYIEMSAEDGQVQRYAYSEWLAYLKGCDAWVASPVAVRLSDAGKRYFSQVQMEEQTDAEAHSGKKKYVFWAENPANNASTKEVPNGKRHFTAGFDADAPVLEDLLTKGVCYEPTRTDTKQYFAEDFILRGVCRDAVSGVSRVVYTADAEAGNAVVWKEAEIQDCAQEGQNDTVNFVIQLADGIYPALAVRAYDMAGNASETVRYLNEEGRYIQVVVDRKEPVLKLEAASAGRPYHGEGDNWTNEDVQIAVTLDRDSCPYAGIYQYEYVYRKIGEDMTDVSENWTTLPVDGRLLDGIDIAEDKNGYFVFRAVSMSGAASKEVQQRVLIQHAAADIKPLIESGADRTKCKDGWYNKQSKTPVIGFAYPDYDTGVTSGEYDAPITLHYRLTRETAAPDTEAESAGERQEKNSVEKTAVIGVLDGEDVTVQPDKSKVFVVKKDDLNQYTVDFGYDQESGAAQDGYYTLEYWTTDRAGNESEKQVHNYKIDCHEPTDLTLELAGSTFDVGEDPTVTYERFYRDAVPGSAQARYGISGKG
ncbi:MAG: hypothetical protein K2P39_02330, partial [Lachnospiraceae bacterium]|nr:hypothetical protein [Lachnospiraceae bacterium]